MGIADDPARDDTRRIESCIERLAAGDAAARGELVGLACDRMRRIAHRMLPRFPDVRRWEQTDDVVQNACMRLHRAVGQIVPHDARSFMGLAAVQIRRELLDLARKHAADGAYAANHETNYRRRGDVLEAKVDAVADETQSPDRLGRWTRLHEAAATLPDEEREVFHLVWYLGLAQAEVAAVLACSTRTVKRRWELVKTLMAKAMQDSPLD
jgi:RNA polymerase sigma factor (sigma-70 family)